MIIYKKEQYLYIVRNAADMEFRRRPAVKIYRIFTEQGCNVRGIESNKLVVSLPEYFATFVLPEDLKGSTETLYTQYRVESIAVQSHDKNRKNLHIRLICSEQPLFQKKSCRIVVRSKCSDKYRKKSPEYKVVCVKGKLLPRCTMRREREVYRKAMLPKKSTKTNEKSLLTAKEKFSEELINDPLTHEEHLPEYDSGNYHLYTKAIRKGPPKATLVKADNEEMKKWNSLADIAIRNNLPEESKGRNKGFSGLYS